MTTISAPAFLIRLVDGLLACTCGNEIELHVHLPAKVRCEQCHKNWYISLEGVEEE